MADPRKSDKRLRSELLDYMSRQGWDDDPTNYGSAQQILYMDAGVPGQDAPGYETYVRGLEKTGHTLTPAEAWAYEQRKWNDANADKQQTLYEYGVQGGKWGNAGKNYYIVDTPQPGGAITYDDSYLYHGEPIEVERSVPIGAGNPEGRNSMFTRGVHSLPTWAGGVKRPGER